MNKHPNVFQDIGGPNAGELHVQAQFVFKIDALMKKRRMKQVEAADILRIPQPDISKMLRGQFRQFSVERVRHFFVGARKASRASSSDR